MSNNADRDQYGTALAGLIGVVTTLVVEKPPALAGLIILWAGAYPAWVTLRERDRGRRNGDRT